MNMNLGSSLLTIWDDTYSYPFYLISSLFLIHVKKIKEKLVFFPKKSNFYLKDMINKICNS